MKTGVLACQQIEKLIEGGQIFTEGGQAIETGQIQPASLDLRLGRKAYRVQASFLPGLDSSVKKRLGDFVMHKMDITEGAVLEKGCVYVVEIRERLALSDEIDAAANAKSSIGRIDLLTRIITDGGVEFDRIPKGYKGALYLEICPRSFSVLVRSGMRLSQIRFRAGKAVLDDGALKDLHAREKLVNDNRTLFGNDDGAKIANGLSFSVDLARDTTLFGNLVGYKARAHTGIIDLDKLGHYAVNEYWEPVFARKNRIILDPGCFYIFRTREEVRIPPDYAAEMMPYLALVGEFRVHYAGFFDPGFGYGASGDGAGARAVLEMRCHEAPFILEHGQSIGRLIFERMRERPNKLYGAEIASNYQGQGLKLAKYFKSDKK